jgi:anti-sigma B factor antagonist
MGHRCDPATAFHPGTQASRRRVWKRPTLPSVPSADDTSDPLALSVRVVRDDAGLGALALAGELDLATVPIARAALAALLRTRRQRILLDLRELRFIDARGLHLLLDAQEDATARGVDFAITDGNAPVARLLELAGLASRFRTVPPPTPT